MCGRYTLTLTPEQVRRMLGYADRPNFPPRYNIAPTQPIAVVTSERGQRRFVLMRWGFLPSWVKDPQGFPLLINARAETLVEKAAFRAAVQRRRCLIPADGFYEWRRAGKARTPFHIRRPDRGLIAFAGLWETWIGRDGSEIDTAAIVTVVANGSLASLHERMPAILGQRAAAAWLDNDGCSAGEAVALLRPAADDFLEVVEVSPAVNKADNDGPELLEPARQPLVPSGESGREAAG
jgi:putative SOS response-associated peptidase YedK